MNEMDKYQYQPLSQEVVQFEGQVPDESEAGPNLIIPIFRRWYVILITCVIVWAIGVPAIWFLVEKQHDTIGTIRISPIISRIIFSDSDSERPMPNYDNFRNTEAASIGGNTVLNRVADKLKDGNMMLFQGDGTDLVDTLRNAVKKGAISIAPEQRSELIKIQITSQYPDEAETIVDAFINSYISVIHAEEMRGGNETINILEDKRKILSNKMEKQRNTIRQLADEFGTGELTSRQEMMLEQVASLQNALIANSIRRIGLEARLQMQQSMPEEIADVGDQLERRNAIINSDLLIQGLMADISQYEELVMVAKQTFTSANPELKSRIEMLQILKDRLKQCRQEVIEEFEKSYEAEVARNRRSHLAEAKVELEQTIEYEKRIRQKLQEQDADTIGIGRKQFTINDQQEQLDHTKEMYNEITRRIEEINIESQRPARISVESYASSVLAQGKRRKMAAAVGFGGMALGCFFALLLARADTRLHSPDEVVRRVGVRIIGTTTNPEHIDKPMLKQQLSDDYQTIRANLGLLNGQESSKIIVVTSPAVGDGKTTFSVNLSISFAKSGEKVLLIDGDLRKPDVARILNLPENSRGLQDLLSGKPIDKVIHRIDSITLDVLAADNRNSANAVDLIHQVYNSKVIEKTRSAYDHIIIDTPPVLAFSDALLWGRISDVVILTSFLERTCEPDLRKAIDRLEQTGAKVIGTVVNNVKHAQSYHRYGYGYRYGACGSDKQRPGKVKKRTRLLLTTEIKEPKPKRSDA